MIKYALIVAALLSAAPAFAQSARMHSATDCTNTRVKCHKPTHESVLRGMKHPDGSSVRFRAESCLLLHADDQEACMSTVDWKTDPKPEIPEGWVAEPPLDEPYFVPQPTIAVCIGVCLVR